MSSTVQSTVEPAGFNRAVADIKQNAEATTAAQSQASEQAWKTGKEFTVFSQGMFEAYGQAGQIYAQGSQDLFRQMAESSRTAFAEALNGFRAFVTAKTVKDRIELQANFARTTAIHAVAESSRFAHAGIELAEKVATPITAKTIAAAESLAGFPKI